MKTKNKIKIIIVALLILIILNWNNISEFAQNNINSITGKAAAIPEPEPLPDETTAPPEVYFCPQEDCAKELMLWLDAAEEYIHCAFFEVGLQDIRDKLLERSHDLDVRLVTDDQYYDEVEDLDFARHDNRSALMHNKFCILDGKAVWTGSFNPTDRGNNHNNNNAIFYHSKNLADTYESEFEEMWSGTYGKGATSEHTEFVINRNRIEAYFCPEDWCANKLIYALQDARESIHFMTFSFTHDEIGEQVLEMAAAGVDVKGVFEKSQNNKYTEYTKFVQSGLDVRWDGNTANMHHKVFIIDNKTVVTGSFNPTANGDERNDENMIIIHDPAVAAEYAAEFEKVWGEASQNI